MTCPVADRERVREAAAELRACDGVIAVDVLAPGTGTCAGWSLEPVTETPLQPVMLERLAAHNLALVASRSSATGSTATPDAIRRFIATIV